MCFDDVMAHFFSINVCMVAQIYTPRSEKHIPARGSPGALLTAAAAASSPTRQPTGSESDPRKSPTKPASMPVAIKGQRKQTGFPNNSWVEKRRKVCPPTNRRTDE